MLVFLLISLQSQVPLASAQKLTAIPENHGAQCHFLQIEEPFDSTPIYLQQNQEILLTLTPAGFEFCASDQTDTIFSPAGAQNHAFKLLKQSHSPSAIKYSVYFEANRAAQSNHFMADLSSVFKHVRVCSCRDQSGFFRIALSSQSKLLAERQALLGISGQASNPVIKRQVNNLVVDHQFNSFAVQTSNIVQRDHVTCFLFGLVPPAAIPSSAYDASHIEIPAIARQQEMVECKLGPQQWKHIGTGTYLLAVKQANLWSNMITVHVTDLSQTNLNVSPKALHATRRSQTVQLQLAGPYLPIQIYVRIDAETYTAIKVRDDKYIVNILTPSTICRNDCPRKDLYLSFDGKEFIRSQSWLQFLPDFAVEDSAVVETDAAEVVGVYEAWTRAEHKSSGEALITSDNFSVIALLTSSSPHAAYECGLVDQSDEFIAWANGSVHEREGFATSPVKCEFTLSQLRVQEPLRVAVRQQSLFGNDDNIKICKKPILIKHRTSGETKPHRPDIKTLKVNGIEHRKGTTVIVQTGRTIQFQFKMTSTEDEYCTFRSEANDFTINKKIIALSDGSICLLPPNLEEKTISLVVANTILLTLDIKNPSALHLTRQLVLKSTEVVFKLQIPISQETLSALDKPNCVFDAGSTQGNFYKENTSPQRYSGLYTGVVCPLPESIVRKSGPHRFVLEYLIFSPHFESLRQEIVVVYFGVTMLSNPWLPRYVELGEMLDFSKDLNLKMLADFKANCSFVIEGQTFRTPYENSACMFPKTLQPMLNLQEDQCYKVTHFSLEFVSSNQVQITNLIDFCIEPIHILSVTPTVLFTLDPATIAITFSRSLDQSRTPYSCMLNRLLSTPLYHLDGQLHVGICRIDRTLFSQLGDSVSVAVVGHNDEQIGMPWQITLLHDLPQVYLQYESKELNRYKPEEIRLHLVHATHTLAEADASLFVATFIVAEGRELSFVSTRFDHLASIFTLQIPEIPQINIQGNAALKIKCQIMLQASRPLDLNELQIPYLPEVIVLQSEDRVVSHRDSVELRLSPASILVAEVRLTAEMDTHLCEFTARTERDQIHLTIARSYQLRLLTPYQVWLTFNYPNRDATTVPLRQVLTFFSQIEIAEFYLMPTQVRLVLSGNASAEDMRCELTYDDRIFTVQLEDYSCKVPNIAELMSFKLLYEVEGHKFKTDEQKIGRVDVLQVQTGDVLMLPTTNETKVEILVESSRSMLESVCDSFYLDYEGQTFPARTSCSGSSASLHFNVTDTFYFDKSTPRKIALFRIKNRRILLQQNSEFSVMLIAPVVIDKITQADAQAQLHFQYPLSDVLLKDFELWIDGQQVRYTFIDLQTLQLAYDFAVQTQLIVLIGHLHRTEYVLSPSKKTVAFDKLLQQPLPQQVKEVNHTHVQLPEFREINFDLRVPISQTAEPLDTLPEVKAHQNNYRILPEADEPMEVLGTMMLNDSIVNYVNITYEQQDTQPLQESRPRIFKASGNATISNKTIAFDPSIWKASAQETSVVEDSCVYSSYSKNWPKECEKSPNFFESAQFEEYRGNSQTTSQTLQRAVRDIFDIRPVFEVFNPLLVMAFESHQLLEVYLKQEGSVTLQACFSTCLQPQELETVDTQHAIFTFKPLSQGKEFPANAEVFVKITYAGEIYGLIVMPWLPGFSIFGTGGKYRYFAQVSEVFAQQMIDSETCQVTADSSLFELYRQAGQLQETPKVGLNFMWTTAVPIEAIHETPAPVPQLYLKNAKGLQVTAIEIQDVPNSSLAVAKIRLENESNSHPCLWNQLQVSWMKSHQLPVQHDDHSVLVPLVLLVQSRTVDLHFSYKGIYPQEDSEVLCDEQASLFNFNKEKKELKETNLERITGCVLASPFLVVRSVDYQILSFKLTETTRQQILCQFESSKLTEAFFDGEQFYCNIPKQTVAQHKTSLHVFVHRGEDEAFLNCQGTLKFDLVDYLVIDDATVQDNTLRVKFQSNTTTKIDCVLNHNVLTELESIDSYRVYRINEQITSATLQCGYAANKLQVKAEFSVFADLIKKTANTYIESVVSSQILQTNQGVYFGLKLSADDGEEISVKLDQSDVKCLRTKPTLYLCSAYIQLPQSPLLSYREESSRVDVVSVHFTSPELILSKKQTILLLKSEASLPPDQFRVLITAEDNSQLASRTCNVISQHLYCQFDHKLRNGVRYSLTRLVVDAGSLEISVPISDVSFKAMTHSQEYQMFELAPKVIFLEESQQTLSIVAKSTRALVGMRIGFCSLDQNSTRAITRSFSGSCTFPTLSLVEGEATISIHDQLGFHLYSDSIDLFSLPSVETTTPRYIVLNSMFLRSQRVIVHTTNRALFSHLAVSIAIEGIGTYEIKYADDVVFFDVQVNASSVRKADREIAPYVVDGMLMYNYTVIGSIGLKVFYSDVPQLIGISQQAFFNGHQTNSVRLAVSYLLPDADLQVWLESTEFDEALQLASPNVPLQVLDFKESYATINVPKGIKSGQYFVRCSQNNVFSARSSLQATVYEEMRPIPWSDCNSLGDHITCGCSDDTSEELLLPQAFNSVIEVCIHSFVDSDHLVCFLEFTNLSKCMGRASYSQFKQSLLCRLALNECEGQTEVAQLKVHKVIGDMAMNLLTVTGVQVHLPPVLLSFDQTQLMLAQCSETSENGSESAHWHSLRTAFEFQMAHFRQGKTFCLLQDTYSAPVIKQSSAYSCVFEEGLAIKPFTASLSLLNNHIAEIQVVTSSFFSNSLILFEPPDLFQTKKQQTVLVKTQIKPTCVSTFDDFRSIQLKCRLVYSGQTALTTNECGFLSKDLQTIYMQLPMRKVKEGQYQFSFSLQGQEFLFASKLTVHKPPQLQSLYPTIVFSETKLYLRGIGFAAFLAKPALCKLTQVTGSFIEVKGQALNDRLFTCLLDQETVDANLGKHFDVDIGYYSTNTNAFGFESLITRPSPSQVQISAQFDITDVTPVAFSVSEKELNDTLRLTVKQSPVLSQENCQCDFFNDKGGLLATTDVTLVTRRDSETVIVHCEVPSLQTKTPDVPDMLKVRIRAQQIATWELEYPVYSAISANHAFVQLLPVPRLSIVDPSTVASPIHLDKLFVSGMNFFQSASLVCVFDSTPSPAIYINQTQVICKVHLSQNRAKHTLQISNDNMRTTSNPLAIVLQSKLPRITKVIHPTVFFADTQPIQISLLGKSLLEFAQQTEPDLGLTLVAKSSTNIATGKCAAQSDTQMGCIGLRFGEAGKYTLSLLIDGLNCDNIQSNLSITVVHPITSIELLQDKFDANRSGNKAVFVSPQLSLLFQLYAKELFKCLVYSDSGHVLYETSMEETLRGFSCDCNCPADNSNLSLDFRIVVDSYYQRVSAIIQCLQHSVQLQSIETDNQPQYMSDLPNNKVVLFLDTYVTKPQVIYLNGKHFEDTPDSQCKFYDSAGFLKATARAELQSCTTKQAQLRVKCELSQQSSKLWQQSGQIYTVKYAQLGYEYPEASSPLQIEFRQKPYLLTIQKRLLQQATEGQIVAKVKHLFVDTEYTCLIKQSSTTITIPAVADFDINTLTCDSANLAQLETSCFLANFEDSYGNLFGNQVHSALSRSQNDIRPLSSEVCFLNELRFVSDGVFPWKLPYARAHMHQISLELDNQSQHALSNSWDLIETVSLHTSLFVTDACEFAKTKLFCTIPELQEQDSLLFDLSLKIQGKKSEQLLVALDSRIELFRNVRITGYQTSEPRLLIQTIDSEVLVYGKNFPGADQLKYSPLLCMYFDKLANFNVLAVSTSDGCSCLVPDELFVNSHTVTLRLSLNGGLDFEESDIGLLAFNLYRAPNVERLFFSAGRGSETNYITVGRQETKTVTLRGTHFQVVDGRQPVCLFGPFETSATYIDQYTITCATPHEILAEYALSLAERKQAISLQWTSNGKKSIQRPANDPRDLIVFTWPQLRTIDGSTVTRLLDVQAISSSPQKVYVTLDHQLAEEGYSLSFGFQCSSMDWVKLTLIDEGDRYFFVIKSSDITFLSGMSESTVTCKAQVLESARIDTQGLNPLQTHSISFILAISDFKIFAIDKPSILMGPWTNELLLTISDANTMTAVQTHFKQVRCALVHSDYHGQTQVVLSRNNVLLKDAVKCYFKAELGQKGSYCVELSFGADILTSSCSQSLKVNHAPVMWQVVEQQDQLNAYSFDSFIKGTNLEESDYLCYYFFYELDVVSKFAPSRVFEVGLPSRIVYSDLAAVGVLPNNETKLSCTFQDALQFYTRTNFIKTMGITNLATLFANKSIQVQSRMMLDFRRDRGVFILAHLLRVVPQEVQIDTLTEGYSVVTWNNLKTSLRKHRDFDIFHPGNKITIEGYFLDNSESHSVHLRMKEVETETSVFSDQCVIVTATRITCSIQPSHNLFGELLLSLEEIGSNLKLSDDSVLSVLVFPIPEISPKVEQKVHITALTKEKQPTTVQLTAKFKDTQYFSRFRYAMVDQLVCKLVKAATQLVQFSTKTTWLSSEELVCQFDSVYVDEVTHFCVEISINGGVDFTSSCRTTLFSHRVPFIDLDVYAPTQSHVEDIEVLTFTGAGFDAGDTFQCVFTLNEGSIGQVGLIMPALKSQTTDVTVVSTSQVTCPSPTAQTSQTHQMTVSIVHSSGLLIYKFSKPFTYFSYLQIQSVSPSFGTAGGGTELQIKVKNFPVLSLYEKPVKCRFRFDFSSAGQEFETPATAGQAVSSDGLQYESDVTITCKTPNVEAVYEQLGALTDYNDHLDAFLQVSELDGQFRRPSQFLYIFKRAYRVYYISPTSGYAGHQKAVMLKGQNFLPETTLLVRLRTKPTLVFAMREVYRWDISQIYFVDRETLVVYLPGISRLNLEHNCRVLVFEVSLNEGLEWTTEEANAEFTFKDMPQMLSLSHAFSNLDGKFLLSVFGFNFENNIVECDFGERYVTEATFVSSTLVHCQVPTVQLPFATKIKLICSDGFVIDHREMPFQFLSRHIITGLSPTIGQVSGGELFTLQGHFEFLLTQEFTLLWQQIDITSSLFEITASELKGKTPPGVLGRAEIQIISDLITYTNDAVYFYYRNRPQAMSCWPPSGQTTSDTMIKIKGVYLDDSIRCQLGDEAPFFPIQLTHETVMCKMQPHKKTMPLPLRLNIWEGQKVIETGCTFFYYDDIIINQLSPNYISTKAHDNGVVIEVRGLFFRNDDPAGNSFQVRVGNDLVLPQEDVIFVSSRFVKFKAPNVATVGLVPVFFSNNYGVQWTDGSRTKDLFYNQPMQVNKLSLDKIQIPLSDTDFDKIRIDIEVTGRYFQDMDSFGPMWCVWGSNTTAPMYEIIFQAEIINSNQIICNEVPHYNSAILPTTTYVEFKVTQNRQEYWGHQRIHYYPKIRIDNLSQHNFAQNQERIVFSVYGVNFLNHSPNELMCVINRVIKPEEVTYYFQETITLSNKVDNRHFSAYVQFISPTAIKCTFERAPMIHADIYKLKITNNGVQWVQYERADRGMLIVDQKPRSRLGIGANGVVGYVGQIDVRPAIEITSIEPKIILTRSSAVNQHVITIEANNLHPDGECYFVLNSTDRASLEHTFGQSSIVKGTLVSPNYMECLLPPDYTAVGEAILDIRIGFERNVKTMSQSSISLRITDKCPNGYWCENFDIKDCPPGYYCPGNAYLQDKRPCPIGYFQEKYRSKRCMPCIRGSYCPSTAMRDPTECPEGHYCNVQKLTSPRSECPAGYYCNKAIQGNEPFFNGLFDNNTFHCDVGTYCRGGQTQRLPFEPTNFESTVQECLRGFVCPQGSKLANGVGACPAGFYCPHRNTTAVICPPRYFCPSRQNIEPTPCPKGTYNAHFGQKNCTVCSLGMICPMTGMFLPTKCPPGYVCNKEGLVIPDNLCRIGNICLGGVKSGLKQSERACYINNQVSDNVDDMCKGNLYSSENSTAVAYYYKYFFNNTVCCQNVTQVSKWLIQIGESINQKEIFKTYAQELEQQTKQIDGQYEGQILTVSMYDGHLLLDQSMANGTINADQMVNLVNPRHGEIIKQYIKAMYTYDQQIICPGGVLCLEGVNQLQVQQNQVTAPFPCPLGSYCLRGSESVIGTGLCPAGYYCPLMTELPFPAQPGYFTSNYGGVDQSPCSPGSFQLFEKATKCLLCPAGYMCKQRGTSLPEICPVGTYRSVIESNICTLCPKGTFAFERGNKDYLECQECPPGRICESEGTKNITDTAPCPDGYVCFSGTGARKSILCPEGYYCPEQTTGEAMYSNQCEGGFFCRPGTGFSTKTRDNCPQTYYCPPGTGVYSYVTNYKDYSNWRTDAPTRCPQGTGQDESDTKKYLLQCVINKEYRILAPGLELRSNFENPRISAVKQETSSRLLRSAQINSRRRNLASTDIAFQSAGKDNPYLLDLYEIEQALSQQKKGSLEKPVFKDWLNYKRQYISSINPLNLSICDAWSANETLNAVTDKNSEGQVIFSLDPHNIALITMDLRHLLPQEYNWVYGEDWSIGLTVSENVTLAQQVDPFMLPEQFLHKDTSKSDVLEFELLALESLQFRVEILIHNALYLNHKFPFINSTSVEIRKPNRANFGTEEIIATQIEEDFLITLPYNQLPLQPNKQQLPIALLSFAKNFLVYDPIIHSEVKSRNIWIPASLYWNQRKILTLSYLPYFSNCQGYGAYIPFWALLEQHHQCELISVEETVFMKELSFGQSPTSDTCSQVVIPCFYDEIIGNGQPLPRWFEVEGGTTLFNLIKQPINFDDFKNKDFDAAEVMGIGPGDQGAEGEGTVPQLIEFSVSYYQLNATFKRLVSAGLEYGEFLELSEAQLSGEEKVPYNISFTLESMNHESLTIAFAFQPYFYIILFVVMGIISIAIMVVMCIFHRLTARPLEGKIAPFRFFSFIQLTIPPCAYGVGLACIPVIIINAAISILVNGRILTYNVFMFDCWTTLEDGKVIQSPPEDCVCTLFDLMKDDSAKISVDYSVLRKGRCGLALFISGAYAIMVGLQILIPDVMPKGRVPEAYDGNVWCYFQWKRSNLVFCSVWVIFIALALIQFSFSDFFGAQIYLSIVLMKVFDQFLEVWLENMLEEKLLYTPLQIFYGMICGLVTFGSDDFLAFIASYFVEFGMMIGERCYIPYLIDFIKEYLGEHIPNTVKAFIKFLTSDDQNLNMFGAEHSESSDSRLDFTDEESFNEGIEIIKNINEQVLYKDNAFWDENNSSSEFSAKFLHKPNKKKLPHVNTIDSNESSSFKLDIDYGKEVNSFSGTNSPEESQQLSEEEEQSYEDDLEEVEVEPLLDEYQGYASDNIGLFYAPVVVLLLWAFFPETVVAANYGIMIYDFKYYFLFQVVIVPFQIVVDVIQLNITEWYSHLQIHDYLDYLAFRFSLRKARWKGSEGTENINMYISSELRSIDQLCYSSQFFFVQTIYVAGLSQIVLGMQTLLWVPEYYCFADEATIPVTVVTFLMCWITEKLCIKGGDILQIWKIDEVVENEAAVETDQFAHLVQKVVAMREKGTADAQNESEDDDIPTHLLWKHQHWGNVDRQKIADLQMKADLKTDRMIAETYKDLFLQHNKPWLKEHVHEMLTPRTVFVHREKIVEQLGMILDHENISVKGSQNESRQNQDSNVRSSSVSLTSPDSSEAENPFALLQKAQNKRAAKQQKKQEEERIKNRKMAKEDAAKISVVSRLIIRYWVLRTRMLIKLRIYVQAIVNNNIQPECLFCRTQYGLRVEIMQNLEDMFYQFLSEQNATIGDYNYQAWIIFFKRNAKYRTTCYNCQEQIEVAHRKERKKIRKREKIEARRRKEHEEIMAMTNVERREWVNHIYTRSLRAYEVISLWVSQARLELSLKDTYDQRMQLAAKRTKRIEQLKKQKLSRSFIEQQLDLEGLSIPPELKGVIQ